MTLLLSPVVDAAQAGHGGHFTARRLDLQGLGEFAAPVMGFDHYRMAGPIFAPHPHAGFSAVSYVFEDSSGGLRNRDSLQHDLVIESGAMVWTQAGSGVVHDEFPAQTGREVHGVQIFINLCARNKALAPRMLHIAARDVPMVMDADSNRTRVLSGSYSGANSPLEPAEPFDLLDVSVNRTWTLRVPARRSVLVYVVSGSIEVQAEGEIRALTQFQAVAGRSSAASVFRVSTAASARILVLSGTDPAEPIAVYGPFIMNEEHQLASAFERYRRGEMGRLVPLATANL